MQPGLRWAGGSPSPAHAGGQGGAQAGGHPEPQPLWAPLGAVSSLPRSQVNGAGSEKNGITGRAWPLKPGPGFECGSAIYAWIPGNVP